MLSFDEPLPAAPRRVIIAGVSGSGKTTLAARISSLTGAPHTEIDTLFHGPGWVPRERFLDDVRSLASQHSWITEWQYPAARPILAERADLAVWLDLPFASVALPRLLRRTLRRRLRREKLWNGNMEPPLRTVLSQQDHILRWAVTTRHLVRARVEELAETHPDLLVVRLRTPSQVRAWLTGPLTTAVAAG